MRACSDRTRGNSLQLKESTFRYDISKKLFTARVLRHWNILPSKAVVAPFLKVFEDGAPSNLEMFLLKEGELEQDDLYGAFQPKPFQAF